MGNSLLIKLLSYEKMKTYVVNQEKKKTYVMVYKTATCIDKYKNCKYDC